MPSAIRQKREQARSGRRFNFSGHAAASLLITFVNNGLPFPVDPERDLDPRKDPLARTRQEAARRSIVRLVRAEKECLSPRKIARISAEDDATLDWIKSELTRLEVERPTESDFKAITAALERVRQRSVSYLRFLDAVLLALAEDRATLAIVSAIEDLCASDDVLDLAECPCGRFFIRERGQARYCPAVTCKARRERRAERRAERARQHRETNREDPRLREARRNVLELVGRHAGRSRTMSQ